MGRLTLSALVSMMALLSTATLASDDKDEIIKKLIERLDKVETELKSLKSHTDKQIDELHIRADDNELSSALSKIKFGLGFETNAHVLDGDGVDSANKWNNVLHLNMNADINDKTTFTGRLGMTKNWADSSVGFGRDTSAGRGGESGSALFVERAYVDYRITDNFIATIGRQPGTDGPGENLRNNSKRQSTYPAMLFNANGDALVLTYKLDDSDSLSNTALRLGYGKAYQWDDGLSSGSLVGEELIDDANIWLGVAESKIDLGSMGDNMLMLSAATSTDFMIPAGSPIGDINIGDLTIGNLYFENNNAFGSPFSWFTSLGYSKGSNAKDNSGMINKAIYDYAYEQSLNALNVTNPANPSNTATATAVANGAVGAQSPSAIASAKLNEEDGWAIHLGARYDFTKELKLGYEFFYGSKYWYSFTTSSASDPINILNTRGKVHDLYAIYQMDLNQFLRFSWTNINYDYTNSGFPVGLVQSSDSNLNHWLLTYNVRF